MLKHYCNPSTYYSMKYVNNIDLSIGRLMNLPSGNRENTCVNKFNDYF